MVPSTPSYYSLKKSKIQSNLKSSIKVIFNNYLAILAISFNLGIMTGCATNTDYYAEISFVFVNDTDKSVSIYNTEIAEELDDNEILLLPYSRDTLTIQGDSGETLDPKICCSRLLINNIYGANTGKAIIKINELMCEIESIANIENYTYEQPKQRRLFYTYIITDEVLTNEVICE